MGRENDIPDYVAAMVMACLHKDPAMRPQNARVLQQWIQSEGHNILLDSEPIQFWGPKKEEPAKTKKPVKKAVTPPLENENDSDKSEELESLIHQPLKMPEVKDSPRAPRSKPMLVGFLGALLGSG